MCPAGDSSHRRRSSRPSGPKIKIDSIEFWGFKVVGPFTLGGKAIMAVLVALFLCAVTAIALVYWVKIRPASNDARDAMRQGEYERAAAALSALSPRWQWWPGVAAAIEQARFGERLSKGHIRDLSPELERLRERQPDHPNVLVFQGISAYYVEGSLDRAIEFFARAADRDPEHVQAHVLAAGRRGDRAYAALLRGDEARARADVTEAIALLDGLAATGRTLTRVARQRAELFELLGANDKAYTTYGALASGDVLSAVQAAMVSWRLPSRIQRGLESAQSALSRLETQPSTAGDPVGWSFRVRETEPVIVRGSIDKKCLTSRIVEISQALVAASQEYQGEAAGETSRVTARPEPPRSDVTAPEYCPRTAAMAEIRDVVCVQLLAALSVDASFTNPRRRVLDVWRLDHIRCDTSLRAPPILPN